MDVISKVSQGYREYSGNAVTKTEALPRSGSDRRYFRIFDGEKTLIGTYNRDREENDAFVGFTEHFLRKQLPVPEVYCYMPEKFIYFQRDLGDLNLYTWLHARPDISDFNDETKQLYKKILDRLILFQTRGIDGLKLDLCYPHKSFDRQSMMWDMNYYKYMLLKLLAVPFRERPLEQDFNNLADYLLETGQKYFLYRDFQTANIMLIDNEPWFIDYQGGRKGAPQYDLASLLFDAKIPMKQENRDELADYFQEKFCTVTNEDKQKFRGYYSGFSMIRLMQALGAFGFRGLYEKKPTFTETLVPAVILLQDIAAKAEQHIRLPELYRAIAATSDTTLFKTLETKRQ
ncbi:MAG TPA: phosphotransferase [Bacteroidales bacterium]|jgi:aminoglycoside/choline kinase family phosphotransferase|nr:phosphotransferase [Bacteroidales bacterium]HQH25221.1 phosphotransferase [Bacteroidales bacterium]HQJ82782.1 phosphotransferase [Bacteroidales bacterium]